MKSPDKASTDRFRSLQKQLLDIPNSLLGSGILGGLWFLAGILLLLGMVSHAWKFGWQGCLVLAGALIAPSLGLIALSDVLRKKQETVILDELVGMDDPRVIRLFLDLTQSNDAYWMPRVKPTLLRLLPRMQRTDAIHFPMRTQEELHNLLARGDSDLILAILNALPQIGTIAALPHVEPLAKKTTSANKDTLDATAGTFVLTLLAQGPTSASEDAAVREAAQRCYAALKARADTVKEPDWTLLRASSAPGTEQTLLRPALPDGAAASDHLLRAHPASHQGSG